MVPNLNQDKAEPLPDQATFDRTPARWLAFILNMIASVTLFALMVITCVDVFGRYVLNIPLTGSTELTEMALCVLVFSVFPVNAWRNEYIVVDMLDRFTSPIVHLLRTVLLNVIGAIALYFLGSRIMTLALRSLDYGERSEYLSIPLGWAMGFIALMCWLTVIVLLSFGLMSAYERYRHHVVSAGSLYR